MDPAQLTPTNLRQFLLEPTLRHTILEFNNHIRSLGNQKSYLELCQTETTFSPTTIPQLIDQVFVDFISSCPPGHDPNHIYRDYLGISATIAHDPYITSAAFPNDVISGYLGGIFHDIGVSIWPRYRESEWECGHAEIGAWLFFVKTNNLLPENLRLLTAYAISAHTHYLKPLPTKIPNYARQPYWDQMFTFEDKPVGLAPWITRFADRIDCNGATLLARHLISTCDSLESGGNNLSGEQFYTINHEALHTILIPHVRPNNPSPPTSLEHISRFAESNFGQSPYSLQDHLFPHFNHLIELKVNQTTNLINEASKPSSIEPKLEDIQHLLRSISGSPIFDRAWKNFETAWDHLETTNRLPWSNILSYLKSAYISWLEELRTYVSTAQHPLISPIHAHLESVISRLESPLKDLTK